jgi:hypothetical protein
MAAMSEQDHLAGSRPDQATTLAADFAVFAL